MAAALTPWSEQQSTGEDLTGDGAWIEEAFPPASSASITRLSATGRSGAVALKSRYTRLAGINRSIASTCSKGLLFALGHVVQPAAFVGPATTPTAPVEPNLLE